MKTLLQYIGEAINKIECMSRPAKFRLLLYTIAWVFIATWGQSPFDLMRLLILGSFSFVFIWTLERSKPEKVGVMCNFVWVSIIVFGILRPITGSWHP